MPGAQKYNTRTREVDAYHWDGSAAEMYNVVGWILANGGTAWIQDGNKSQGPDLIRLETEAVIAVLYPNGWAVKDLEGKFAAFTDEDFRLKHAVDSPDS